VIDESGAAQMLLPESRRKKTIGIKEIETTISTMARIPPKTVSKDDAEVLQYLEQTLKTVIYGQDKVIESLSASIKLARAGLREPEKPIGCYLFSGLTDVRASRGGSRRPLPIRSVSRRPMTAPTLPANT
jgi:ATP-dependent Clp protease ATP-binding subunit ClpA